MTTSRSSPGCEDHDHPDVAAGPVLDKIAWRYFPTYDPASPPTNILQGTLIGPCTTDGKLPTGKDVCLLSPVKSGNSGTWTFLQNGTGSDPGFGS